MTEQFRLWVGLMIIGNFIITYVTEKFGIWYLSVWWKNRQDRKRQLERQREIEEEERAMGFKKPSKRLTAENTGGVQNVYLPKIDDEGDMGEESPVQNIRRKVLGKQNDQNEIEFEQEEHKNQVDEKDHTK